MSERHRATRLLLPGLLPGLLCVTVLAGCAPLDRLRGEGPPGASPGASSAPGGRRTATAADLESLLAGLGTEVSADQAVAAAESLAAALGAAVDGGDDVERVEAVVTEALDRAMSTPRGRQALLAAGQALDGHVLGPAAGTGSGTVAPTGHALVLPGADPSRVQLAAAQREPVRYYFVNGVLNSYADALATRERLAWMLGTDDVTLVYNESAKELWDMEVHACARAIQRAGLADEIIATDRSWSAWLTQKLNNSVTAGLRAACAAADRTAELTARGLSAAAAVRGLLELAVQRTVDADFGSSAVNHRLVPMLKEDLLAGRRVVLVGHSQGTLFVRNAVEQVRGWWNAGAGGRRPAPCQGLFAPGTQAPLGAMYISPAFTADNNSRLQRYVVLKGDILQEAGVSRSEWTAEPDSRQSDPDVVGDSVGIHGVKNYLLARSESLGQVTDNVTVLRTALNDLQGLDPCPSESAEPGASPSGIVSGASEWVVWRALKPYEGIGINVTSKRSYAEDDIASRWSGGGLDPEATFRKEMLINTVFPSKDEALAVLCTGLSEVRMWPLGAGMHGVWQGTPYALGDSVECRSS